MTHGHGSGSYNYFESIMNQFRKLTSVGLMLFLLSALLAAASPTEMLAISHADEAIRQLHRQVNSDPKNADAYSLLCRVYFQLGDWDNAIANGERAVQLNSEVSAYHLWLGRAYGRKAETVNLAYAFVLARRVVKEFERANQLDPGDWSARRDLADFYVQAPVVVGGGESKAQRLAHDTQGRDAVGASIIRAMIALRKKDTAEAERQYQAAIRESSGAAGPWLNLARLYRDGNRWDKFDDAVRHALSSTKQTSEDLFDTGELLGGVGRMLPQAAEALRLYLKGGTADEHDDAFRAHYLLGRVLEQLGDRQGAIGEYRFSLTLASGFRPAQDALRRLGA
jgi:tetratricopeptide (TPR) repeat protein